MRILIDNALRYGDGEPIRVTAADATIEVADRGPGVPPEERERIFERFYRGRARGSDRRLRARAGDRPRARGAHGRHAHALGPAGRRHALRALAAALAGGGLGDPAPRPEATVP